MNFNIKPNVLARRMISAIPCNCPHGCEEKTTHGNLKDHVVKCPRKPCHCNVDGCNYEGAKDDFLKHIQSNHNEEILKRFTSE